MPGATIARHFAYPAGALSQTFAHHYVVAQWRAKCDSARTTASVPLIPKFASGVAQVLANFGIGTLGGSHASWRDLTLRLLVIEDDPDLNRQLATALADAGYVVDR